MAPKSNFQVIVAMTCVVASLRFGGRVHGQESDKDTASGFPQRISLDPLEKTSSPSTDTLLVQPPQVPLAQRIRIEPPATDRVTVGKIDGLADFRDFPTEIPDSFGALDQVMEIKPLSGKGVDEANDSGMSSVKPRLPVQSSTPFSNAYPFFPAIPAITGVPFISSNSNSVMPIAVPQFVQSANNGIQSSDSVTAVFENAAHFSLAGGCSSQDSAMSRRSVMIYEGMTLQVFPTGAYVMRFVAEAPDVPSIVQLQLSLQERGVPVGKITIPPIVIRDAENSSRLRYQQRLPNQTRSWLVQRKGYSHVLRGITGNERQRLSVTRSGTVQMGQVPERTTNY